VEKFGSWEGYVAPSNTHPLGNREPRNWGSPNRNLEMALRKISISKGLLPRLLGLGCKDKSAESESAAVPPPSSIFPSFRLYLYLCLCLYNDAADDAEEGNQNKEERQTARANENKNYDWGADGERAKDLINHTSVA